MKKTDLSRRDFNRLSMAAFGGVVAGTFAGCANDGEDAAPSPVAPAGGTASEDSGTTEPEGGDTTLTEGEEIAAADKNVCRGLNVCKGHGAGGENSCAGTGACATFAAHECAGNNECKGQGGCGSKPGENACKSMGSCAVPLKDHAWGKARANFEAAMKAAGKEAGPAPVAAS